MDLNFHVNYKGNSKFNINCAVEQTATPPFLGHPVVSCTLGIFACRWKPEGSTPNIFLKESKSSQGHLPSTSGSTYIYLHMLSFEWAKSVWFIKPWTFHWIKYHLSESGLLPNSVLFGRTVSPNSVLFGRTVPPNSFPQSF